MVGDSYTEVEHRSWLGRMMDSIKGVLAGIFFFFLSIVLLWTNEKDAVEEYKALAEGRDRTVVIKAEQLVAGNEGKLVLVSGRAESSEVLMDPQFNSVAVTNALCIRRESEMYQWKENVHRRRQGDREIKEYRYEKVWSKQLISSSGFKKRGHQNPTQFSVPSSVQYAKNAKLGAFGVSNRLIDEMDEEDSVTHWRVRQSGWSKDQQYYYLGNARSPRVGDTRLSFKVVPAHEVTIVAQQSKGTLVPYMAQNGREVALAETGRLGLDEMFSRARDEQARKTWIMRGLGCLIMALAFGLMLKPFATLFDWIPILGSLVELGTILFSIVVASGLSTLVIAVAWVFHRPLVGIGLLLGALVIMLLPRFTRKKKPLPNRPSLHRTTDKTSNNLTAPNMTTHQAKLGTLSSLNPQLRDLLEICAMYLVALDEQFTPQEQDWVDDRFGTGTANRFIERMPKMDWAKCFDEIRIKLLALSPADQQFMQTQAKPILQSLMVADGVDSIEQERMNALLRFMEDCLNKPATQNNLRTAVAPGHLSHLSPPLLDVLELCTLYLVALDEQFTPEEQDWVDEQFGVGTANRFIKRMPSMDWENCFDHIFQKLQQLNPQDRFFMNSQSGPLFQTLMESDGMEEIERERLGGLMRYISESLGYSTQQQS